MQIEFKSVLQATPIDEASGSRRTFALLDDGSTTAQSTVTIVSALTG